MPAQIKSGSITLSPAALSAYSSDQDGGTITHPILGRTGADVTLRPAAMRTGSFTLDFRTSALSESARASLSTSAVWNLTHPEQVSLNMKFVVTQLTRGVEGNGRWPVTVRFEEIP